MTYQLGASLTDAIVLAIIAKGDTYGYSISQEMKKVADLKESTLYPVLRRLQNNGYLGTYDRPFQGRNRKYYYLTPEGKKQYQHFVDEWLTYRTGIEEIILGGINNGQE